MAATAAARRVAASPTRRATASRSSLKPRPRKPHPARARPRRRRSTTPVTGFVPVVVGRTAGAVGGIADSGVVVRMTRGRIWIGVLGALLVGIVALNVWALGLNASSSKVAQQTDGLKRANSALQAQIAGELSNERVQQAAARIGLAVPEPGAVRYLESGGDAATVAARRLAAGELTVGTVAPEAVPAPVIAPETAVEAPAETAPVETEPVVTGP
jgi:hypothetical protein